MKVKTILVSQPEPKIENSPYFENVKTTYTTTKKDRGEEYTKFEIICMYEKEDEYDE